MFLIPASFQAVVGMALLFLGVQGSDQQPINIPGELWLLLPITMAAIIAAWRILGAFILQGELCFRSIHSVWWWLATLGATMVVPGLIVRINERMEFAPGWPSTDDFMDSVFLIGYMGFKLLIPFTHVSIERWRHERSKDRREDTIKS